MKDKLLVSVVIPTYNSSSTLEICLKSLKFQSYSHVEIIVVDNLSKDDTKLIAERYGARVFQVKASRSAARNYGARKARGELLFFVDADTELKSKVVEEAVRKVVEDGCDAIMIPEIRVGRGFWAKCRALERLTYIGNPLIESARLFRKDVFKEVGGYDEELEAGEDWDLHLRIENAGYRIGDASSLIKHHEGQISLKKIVIKRLYYGKKVMKYVKKHPLRASIQYCPIRLDFIKHWRILAQNPLYGCGMLIMKMIEYLTTIIAMISALRLP